jgi:hypothetical protein
MDYSSLMKTAVDTVLLPALVIIGSSVLIIVKSYVKNLTDSIIAKNELISLGNIASIKNHILSEIATLVQAAVCTNMTIAQSIKAGGNKLSESEVIMLQESAKQLVYNSLPVSLTDEAGSMLKILGGKDKLD